MKKLLTLCAILAMCLTAFGQETVLFDADGTYGNGAILSSENTVLELGNDRALTNYTLGLAATKAYCSNLFGQKVMVENTDTHEMEEKTRVVYVVGNNNPKDGELDGDDKSTGNGYSPEGANLPQSGTYYMITPAKPGHITAFVILNASKSLYVVKGSNGECLPVSALTLKGDGAEPVSVSLNNDFTIASKMTGTLEFDVEEGETYYVFCTGSKLSFGGYKFVEGESTPTITKERVLFDANGTYGNGAILTSENTVLELGNDRALANYTIGLSATKAYCSNLFGQKVMVENSDTHEMEEKVRVVYVVGVNNPKDGELDGDDKSTGVSYSPEGANLPQSGTYYMITPAKPGHITAFVILNAGKNFYVVKGSSGECLPVSAFTFKGDGAEPTDVKMNDDFTLSSKMTGTVEFDVEAGETYYVFCTGSKLSFGGYEFVEGEEPPVPIVDTRELVLFDAEGVYGNAAELTSEHTKLVLGNDRATKNYDVKLAATKAYCSKLFGQNVMVENTETHEMEEKTRVVYVVGGNNPLDGELDDEDKSTGVSYSPGGYRIPQSGTYYKITTTIPGHITAFVILNASKNFYVVKGSNAECLPVSDLTIKGDGAAPVDVTLGDDYTLKEKTTGTVEFDVVAGETYYVFCTGSKLSFGGYEFVSGNGGEPEVLPGDANGDGDVNITDVSSIVEFVLSGKAASFNFKNADINGDGDVNITDASVLVGIILNN
ncbi:MAG: dockerin type I repeat-containing protein [Prevotella sp.]|nr:dockerin type I repeat-containing protein [Prevotella sp.]